MEKSGDVYSQEYFKLQEMAATDAGEPPDSPFKLAMSARKATKMKRSPKKEKKNNQFAGFFPKPSEISKINERDNFQLF